MKSFLLWLIFMTYFVQIIILVLGCIFETIKRKSTFLCLVIPFGFVGWLITIYKEMEE